MLTSGLKYRLLGLLILVVGLKSLKAQTTLYVGTGGGEYASILSAYAACTGAGTNYIIEIKSTYNNTEAKPIVFAANVAASILIRPHSSIVSLNLGVVTGSETSIISFTAGDNITIDGRIASSGSTSVLTIENTQNASAKYAIQFSGGSTGNTIKYCSVLGSNTSSSSSSTSPGVIMFGSGTNSNNTIDHCTIRESGANLPLVGINSYDGTNNNSLTITNNNFINFEYRPVYANGNNNASWTITGNSFYQTNTQTGGSGDITFIYIAQGGGYTITGNYFGGQDINCGVAGTPFTFTGDDGLNGIYFNSSTAATTNTISANTFQNIAYTTTKGAGAHLRLIATNGSADFIIGSSGNANVIGATTGTGSIVSTDNGTAGSTNYLLCYINSSGTNTIAYNTIGAVTFDGSNTSTSKALNLIDVRAGTTSISNNTIGNTTGNNINLNTVAAVCYGVYNPTVALSFTNNVVRNIQHAGTGAFYLVNNQGGILTFTGNTISGLSQSGSGSMTIVYNGGSGLTASNNGISSISNTSTGSCYIFSNSANDATISSNTVSTISSASTNSFIMVSNTSGNCTVSGNTFTSLTLTGNASVYLIYNVGGTLSATSNAFSGFTSSSTSGGQYIIYHSRNAIATISSNTIYNVNISSSSSNAYLIYIGASTSDVNLNSNTIGQYGVSNDIILAGNNNSRGVYIASVDELTASGNIMQNFYLSSNGTSNIFDAFEIWATGTLITLTDNVVDNITTESTKTSSGETITGIYYGSSISGTITHNTFSDFTSASTAATTGGRLQSLYMTSSMTGTLNFTKNRVTGFVHNTTIASSTPLIYGVRGSDGGGTYNFYNNVILLSNGSNTQFMNIIGISVSSSSTGTFNIYHNTIKVSGSTAGASESDCILISTTTGTYTLKNNIFQNARTGGSASHYGIKKSSAGTTFAEDFNYVEASTYGYWEGSTKTTLANWQVVSGASDYTGSITITSSGAVPTGTVSDVKLNGMDYNATVTDDIDGNSRADAPWRGAYETTTPLPVELLSFNALPVGKEVESTWTTITETNNHYFSLERSVDGLQFETLAIVNGAGNSHSLLNYSHTDKQPLKGLSYYRLKQTDFDGKYAYSQLVPVKFSGAGDLNVYPNPTENSVLLSFFSTSGDTYTLQFFDAKGSIVKCQYYTADEDGINNLTVDLSNLEPGIYFFYLLNRTEMLKTRVVKQ